MSTMLVPRLGLFSVVLLSAACGSKEASIAGQRQLSTDPPSIVVHSEFGVDPSIPALTGEEPEVAYDVGPPPGSYPDPMGYKNGGIHLVVWSDGNDVYGERLSGEGAPLEPGQFVISASDGAQTHPSVSAFDNDQYVIVFEDNRSGSGVYATHVDFDGNVTGEVAIAQGSGQYSYPAVSCPRYCFAVWKDGSEIMGEPLEWDYYNKVFLTHTPMHISNAAGHGSAVVSGPSIAWNTTYNGYLVAWNESPAGGSSVDVHAVRLSIPPDYPPLPDGGLPPPVILEQPEIVVAQDAAALAAPSVATGYLVSWVKSTGTSTGAIVAARVGDDGSVLDSPPLSLGSVATTHGGSPPNSMSSGLVVWDDDRSALYGARVTQTGEVVTLGRIASAPPGGSLTHARGSVATQVLPPTGVRYRDIVVWTQSAGAADPSDRLFLATQNPDGASFDAPSRLVGAGTPAGAAVTGNASEFLVLWSGHGMRFGRDGTPLDAHPFAAPTGALASNGTDFAVVWSASGDIHGSKIGQSGTVGPDVTIIAGPNLEAAPAIASNGSNYVLLWLEYDSASGGISLHEAALDLDLNVRQTTTIATEDSPDLLAGPAVASDGDAYMAVWPEITRFFLLGIYGNRIQADGSTPENSSFNVAQAGHDEYGPSIAPAGGPGAGYVVAYTERSGNSKGEIRALHVWPPVTIGDPTLYEDSPSVGRICDESFVTWTRGDYTVNDYPPGPRDLIGATIANGTATEVPISATTNDEGAGAIFGLGSSALVVYPTFAGVRARLVTGNCGGSPADGGGAGGQPGSGGASGFDGGTGAVTGSGGSSGLPDASGSGGAIDGAATGGASSSGGNAGAPDAGSGGSGGADAGRLDASSGGGAGGSGSGGVSGGGAGGENGSGGHAGAGGYPGTGGSPASGGIGSGAIAGMDAGTTKDGGPGPRPTEGGCGCRTTAGPRSSTSSSLLALVALSVVGRRSARRWSRRSGGRSSWPSTVNCR